MKSLKQIILESQSPKFKLSDTASGLSDKKLVADIAKALDELFQWENEKRAITLFSKLVNVPVNSSNIEDIAHTFERIASSVPDDGSDNVPVAALAKAVRSELK